MSKRFLIAAAAVLAVAGAGILFVHIYTDPERDSPVQVTEQDKIDAWHKQLGAAPTPMPATTPVDPKQQIRLAIGNLGLATEVQSRQTADLTLVDLAGAEGLEMVERHALDAVLKELNLGYSGLVRAQELLHAGKLLRADWFLVGSAVNLTGTNYTVVRIVDAHTGVTREVEVFAIDNDAPRLAAALASFARRCRQNAATAKSPVFLSVGSFEDLSVNNRQATLPTQLRGYLLVAYRGTPVTLLEREFADVLFREMRLDLAGLTDESGTNVSVMQSAYWMVDGSYQSYETSVQEAELELNVRRMFGKTKRLLLRDKPGEPLFQRVKETLDTAMQNDQGAVFVSRVTELRAQLAFGKDIFHAGKTGFGDFDLIWLSGNYSELYSDSEKARRCRNTQEAMRAFETVLLLDPKHRLAKLYLAACCRHFCIDRLDEAQSLYRELIEDGVNDSLTTNACLALVESLGGATAQERLDWFEAANQTHAHEFYQSQIKAAGDQIALGRKGTPEAEVVAERKLFEEIAKWERSPSVLNFGPMGFENYVKAFGTNRTRAASGLVALLPRMLATSSNLSPYLIAGTLIYQVETNAPVVAQFEKSLEEATAHPEKLFMAKHYFSMVSREVYNWAVEHRLFLLAAQTKEARERMARLKLAEPLDSDDKMGLAFNFLQAEAWHQALEVFQSYSNRPVRRGFSGEDKEVFLPVFTGKQANYCREKLGLPVQVDAREFEMGTNCLCLHSWSEFLTDADGLWVAIDAELIRLGFDLKTNFVVQLPTKGDASIRVLCSGADRIWIGTDGAGLIEFDKSTRLVRQFTVKDGLLMDSIASLHVANDTLWIGYGNTRPNRLNNEGGGLGRLDLTTQVAQSFTLSLAAGDEVHRTPFGNLALEQVDKPTRRSIHALASGPDGEILFATEFHPLRQYNPQKNVWAATPIGSGSCIAADAERLYGGSVGNSPVLGVTVWEFKSNKVWGFDAADSLPYQKVTALCLDGQDLWVGGFGFVALVDTDDGKVRKFAYVPASSVDEIQVGNGYVWAKYDWHLHKTLLSTLR